MPVTLPATPPPFVAPAPSRTFGQDFYGYVLDRASNPISDFIQVSLPTGSGLSRFGAPPTPSLDLGAPQVRPLSGFPGVAPGRLLPDFTAPAPSLPTPAATQAPVGVGGLGTFAPNYVAAAQSAQSVQSAQAAGAGNGATASTDNTTPALLRSPQGQAALAAQPKPAAPPTPTPLQQDQAAAAKAPVAPTQDPAKSDPAAVAWAKTQQGKPYTGPVAGLPESTRWGDPGWDCSSFVYTALKQAGYDVGGAYTDTIAQNVQMGITDPQPGDIVFFSGYEDGQSAQYKHVGIYLGNGMMIDAQYGRGVGYTNVPGLASALGATVTYGRANRPVAAGG